MAENNTPTPADIALLDDLPAQADALDFQPYIDTLAQVVQSPNTRTPLTIGVFGTWGSGKTTLMRLVWKGLPKNYRVAWFDAWKYQNEMDLWRALLLTVLDTLRQALPKGNDGKVDEEAAEKLDRLRTRLYRSVTVEEVGGLEIDWGKLAGGIGQGVLQIGLSFIPGVSTLTKMVEELQKEGGTAATSKLIQAIQRERAEIVIEQVQFLKDFQDEFRQIVEQYVVQQGHRLVVFVDDLDRCLPEKAVEVLEAIKLFLDVKGCVFVLGLDEKVIARGVEVKYRQLGQDKEQDGEQRQQRLIEGARYLEKIIQLPFQLPPIDQEKLEDYIINLVPDWEGSECPRVYAAGLGGNPRQVKRAVNTHLLLTGLAARRQMQIEAVRLAKIVAIQYALPDLYEFLKEDNHHFLQRLEVYYLNAGQDTRQARPEAGKDLEAIEEVQEAKTPQQELPPELTPFLRQRGIRAVRLVLSLHPDRPEYNFGPLAPEDLRAYFTLTRRAEAPELPLAEAAAAPQAVFEPRVVTIPAGNFLMGTSQEEGQSLIKAGYNEAWLSWEQPQHRVTLPVYRIGAAPVTNRQYQAFIRDSEHAPPRHWDGDQYPEGKGEHPVVYVSWQDAVDYCLWLGDKTGKPYRLPTEAEWEKAARGTEGHRYPWGNQWDPARCNSGESNLRDTSPVGQFSPKGDSPYGCADMAGNVWEWCADWFAEEAYSKRDDGVIDPQGPETGSARVLRGGAFHADPIDVRCALRVRNDPLGRDISGGFRVCAASPS